MTSAQRGYGAEHKRVRAEWAPIVAAGSVRCARCRRWIAPGQAWDLGHNDRDRSVYNGPEHAHCNRSAGGWRIYNARRKALGKHTQTHGSVTSRAW